MPAIVEFPKVVQDAARDFGDLFSCEPQRRHFAEYLTGLMVAENKTITGINGEFAETTDQSCLNRFITEVGWFWDHAESRNKIARDYLFVNYVCAGGKHYPLEFRRFKKRDRCGATGETFENHSVLFCQLVDWVCERKGKEQKAEEFAASIPSSSRKEIRRGDKRQWYFTCTIRIPNVNHKVRIVIIWDKKRDSTPRKILVTNRVRWEVCRILRVYRHRWTGTETYHRDGKQELGMGNCQLRSGQGRTRHMYLVMPAYSLLASQLKQGHAKDWALRRLTTIGEACRAMLNETLRTTPAWAIEQVTEKSRSYDHVAAKLGST